MLPQAPALSVAQARLPIITLFGLVTFAPKAFRPIATFEAIFPQPTPKRIPFSRASPQATSSLYDALGTSVFIPTVTPSS